MTHENLRRNLFKPLLERILQVDGLERQSLAFLCGRSSPMVSRYLRADGTPPPVEVMKSIRAQISERRDIHARMIVEQDPDLESALERAIQEYEKKVNADRRWTAAYSTYGFEAALEQARDLIVPERHQVREDFVYEVEIHNNDDSVLKGYRLHVATVKWKGWLSGDRVWISFVEKDELLRDEFLEWDCLYREVVKGVGGSSRSGDSAAGEIQATLRVDGGEKREASFEYHGREILRAYFDVSDLDATKSHGFQIDVRSPMRIGSDTLNIKIDGYFVVGKCEISFTAPVPLKEVELFESTPSNRLGTTHDQLWDKNEEGANRFKMTAKSQVTFPGSGILFKWPLRFEVLPIHGDLSQVAIVHERSREAFDESYDFIHEKDPLSLDFLREHQAKGMLIGLYEVFRRPIDSKDHNSLVGFAVFSRLPRDEEGAFDIHLDQVSLLPELHNRRFGQRLIHSVLGMAGAMGAEGVSLITFAGVQWNGPYYERLGFRFLEQSELSAEEERMLEEDIAELTERGAADLTGERERRVMRHDLGFWKPLVS